MKGGVGPGDEGWRMTEERKVKRKEPIRWKRTIARERGKNKGLNKELGVMHLELGSAEKRRRE